VGGSWREGDNREHIVSLASETFGLEARRVVGAQESTRAPVFLQAGALPKRGKGVLVPLVVNEPVIWDMWLD